MIALWLALAGGAGAAECALDAAADAPFEERLVRAEGVLVVAELWADGAPPGWLRANLEALESRDLPGTVVARVDTALAEDFGLRAGADHALVLRFDEAPVKAGADGLGYGEMKAAARLVRKEAGLVARGVAAPTPGRLEEALLRRAGFREILDLDGPATAVPRLAVQYEDQFGAGVLVPRGPYAGPCGPDPRVGPFTPAAADRAGRALGEAGRVQGLAVLRVALRGAGGVAEDAAVLARWLDEVVLPSGARVVEPREIRLAAQRQSRGDVPERGEPGGRLVTEADLLLAAAALDGAAAIPRQLPGGLNPTEAFLGFALWLAQRSEGEVVRLGELRGPASDARTSLEGPIELPPAAVRATAAAVVVALPDQVPSALRVEGELLTAAELLVLFASAVRGDAPALTRPVAVPEPNAAGLGWGAATLP